MTPEQRRAYLKHAAKNLEIKKAKEAEAEKQYYQNITTGKKWLLFKLGALLCIVFSILLTIDFYKDGESEYLPIGSYHHDRVTHFRINAAIWVEDDFFTPHYKDFVSVDYESFFLIKSSVFNNSKYVSYEAHTLGDRERFGAYKRYSVYSTFPVVQVLLLIPFFVFLFKRPKPWFTFARKVCLMFIYPGAAILLIALLI